MNSFRYVFFDDSEKLEFWHEFQAQDEKEAQLEAEKLAKKLEKSYKRRIHYLGEPF